MQNVMVAAPANEEPAELFSTNSALLSRTAAVSNQSLWDAEADASLQKPVGVRFPDSAGSAQQV